MGVPDGILQGVVACPKGGHDHDICMVGSPLDLMKVVAILGLEPCEENVRQHVEREAKPGDPFIFKGEGSYLTMRPVERASDFIGGWLADQMRNGEELPPFPF